jgi:hypothetical protein
MKNGLSYKKSIALCFCLCLLAPLCLDAHVDNPALEKLSRTDIFFVYLQLGFTHILPLGFDHILFILSLFLLKPQLKTIIWQATAFTVAHSITLGLAMYGLVSAPSHIIEPIIALSIMFVALENIITDKLNTHRILIVFGFGLIHGFGFAGVLKDLGLPKREFMNALISFNLGVELGQITIILAAWLLFGKWFNKKSWYRARIVYPLSIVIAIIALYWTIERVFL